MSKKCEPSIRGLQADLAAANREVEEVMNENIRLKKEVVTLKNHSAFIEYQLQLIRAVMACEVKP